MLCTDSGVKTSNAHTHPRLVGSFPRILGKYVRERKVTSLPASVYGLKSKGVLSEGMDADICVFDADRITDRADFVNSSLENDGIEYVIIDGKIILEKGKYTGERAAFVYTKTN